MARHLFIVSRHHASLFTYLTERFQGDPKVEIIIDRRIAERRRGEMTPSVERRCGDRRTKRPDDDLCRSHIIVTIP